MDNTIIMLSLIFFLLLSFIRTTTSLGSFISLALNQSLQDGETLVSSGGTFEVGFFSPGNSTNRYLGIWYKNVSPLTVIWVANREIPLESNSGVLKLNQNGALVILSGTNSTIWSSFNNTPGKSSNPIAQVLDSGNLVLKNTETKERNDFLWQSFDYPGDTFVPEE
ncbi:hypothetical protein S245_008229 [Arachis hypogaea]